MGKANRGSDTGPERRLRSELHRRGLRFRLQRRVEPDVRTKVDITFGPARVAVFVDGCFWHMCPEHGTLPKANHDWWLDKLMANVSRDRRVDRELAERGWLVIRVWEHEDPTIAAERISRAVLARSAATNPDHDKRMA